MSGPAKKKVIKSLKKREMPKRVQEEEVEYQISDADLDAAIERLGEIKSQMNDLEPEDAALRQTVREGLKERNLKTKDVAGVRVTYKAPMRTVIHEDALKTRLGSKMWERITTKALDMNKLKAYIASGEIDTAVVAACSSEEPNTPYVEIRKR